MKIRIRSDGTRGGTHVTDERGVRIEMITGLEWKLEGNGFATARLTMVGVPVDVVGEVEDEPAEATG